MREGRIEAPAVRESPLLAAWQPVGEREQCEDATDLDPHLPIACTVFGHLILPHAHVAAMHTLARTMIPSDTDCSVRNGYTRATMAAMPEARCTLSQLCAHLTVESILLLCASPDSLRAACDELGVTW